MQSIIGVMSTSLSDRHVLRGGESQYSTSFPSNERFRRRRRIAPFSTPFSELVDRRGRSMRGRSSWFWSCCNRDESRSAGCLRWWRLQRGDLRTMTKLMRRSNVTATKRPPAVAHNASAIPPESFDASGDVCVAILPKA